MNIFISQCKSGDDTPRDQQAMLEALWQQSSREHALVGTPEQADIIIVCNILDTNWYENLRTNPVVDRFTDKCFAVSENYWLIPFLRGVHINSHTGLWLQSRYRSGSYALYYPDFKNPFVEEFPGCAADFPKKFLASFTGRDCHPARSIILNQSYSRKDIHVRDTSSFDAFTEASDDKAPAQAKYLETLRHSKFALCPRGAGAASVRLYEAMRIGVAPVVISDDWVFPEGPDWSSFTLIVKENELSRLEEILCRNEHRYVTMGRLAAAAYQQYFSDENYFDYLIDQMIGIRTEQFLPERWLWRLKGLVLVALKAQRRLGQVFKRPE